MANRINSETSLFAVFGNPVAHSLSPIMHNRAFAESGFNGVYTAFRVSDIEAAMAAVRAIGIRGASVTIPHKVTVMNALDEIDSQARRIGAVNTVVNCAGRLHGYNSDGQGAIKALLEKTSLQDAQVAIIGAGGAARAIGFGLVDQGARLTVINRSAQSGENLAKDIGAQFRLLADVKALKADILINATPEGMHPRIEMLPLPPELLHKDMRVMDIVYNPFETALLRYARSLGCRTIDGVAMFVYQGAFQFSLWTGLKAPLEAMRSAVYAALGAKAMSPAENNA